MAAVVAARFAFERRLAAAATADDGSGEPAPGGSIAAGALRGTKAP